MFFKSNVYQSTDAPEEVLKVLKVLKVSQV
jgi:hypothetical protein